MRLRDILILCLVAFLWGFNFIVIRWGLDAFPPLLFSALRFAVCLVPIAFGVARPNIPWSQLLLLGTTLGLLVFALLYLGIHFGLGAGLASVVMQAQVFFTLLLASVVLGEELTGRAIVASLVALLGLVLIATGGDASFTVLGFGLTLGGAFAWGVSNVLMKRLPPVNALNLMVWISLVPPLPLLLASYVFEGPEAISTALQGVSLPGTLTILYTSAVSTIFAYGVWGNLMQKYSASRVAPFALLVPVAGLASARFFLGAELNTAEWLGAAGILLALVINTVGQRRPFAPPLLETHHSLAARKH
ncbi:EamA family transporter [Allorhizobium borbori]|uniref:O-acetylserine/cysteine efflux transporter n=1 Tax=Allorhizobium borbori TaxID=485907 RepID=A0A7W6P452_9HYPH|nr:EamA family transporter [Allorhizobium borbori]MBB4105591.1 O-acetylserine/cysteine efflux transporter [Allorhizobium borbori]